MLPEDFLAKLKQRPEIDVLNTELDEAGQVMRINIFIRRYGAASIPRWVILDNDWDYFVEKFGLAKAEKSG